MTPTFSAAARRAAFFLSALVLLSACDATGDDGGATLPGQPTAVAGADQAAEVGRLVTLDGSASTDPDGDALTYSWVFTSTPAGSAAALAGANAVATFTPDVPGAYTARLTVSDGVLSDTDDVTVTATAPAFIPIDGDFGTTQTLPAGTYRVPVNARIEVEDGVALTLAPGVRIEFGSGSELIVNGGAALIARGSAAQPIELVGETPVPGLWNGLGFRSNDPRNALDFVTVQHAGAEALYFMSGPGNVGVDGSARVAITNSTIRDSGTNGLALDQGADLSAFSGNTLTANNGYPVTGAFDHAPVFDASSTYAGNATDSINITGSAEIDSDQTLDAVDVPFRLSGRQEVEAGLLTVAPGTRLEFASGAELHVVGTGAMRAVGTAAQPIEFVGEAAVAGLWNGLGFRSSDPRNVLDFVTVAHGGADTHYFTSDAANVGVDGGARVTVTNSTIRDSDGWGIWGDPSADVTQSGNAFSNNPSGNFNDPAL